MGKKYTLSVVSMDQEHLGSNPLFHSGLVLSEYDDKTGRMQVLNAWGLYSSPNRESGMVSDIMRAVGVGFWVTGGYGKIQNEAMAYLDRGIGLQGHTVEITAESKEELLENFRQQQLFQYDALEEARAVLISAGIDKKMLDFLLECRKQPSQADAVINQILAADLSLAAIDGVLQQSDLTADQVEQINMMKKFIQMGASADQIKPLFDPKATVADRISAVDANLALLYKKAEKKATINPQTILQAESAWLNEQKALRANANKMVQQQLIDAGVPQDKLAELCDDGMPLDERAEIIDECIKILEQKAAANAKEFTPDRIKELKSLMLYAQRLATAEKDNRVRLEPFNFNLFSSDANYCKAYAINMMEKVGVPANVRLAVAGYSVVGKAPRYSGGQTPTFLHSEGGFQTLDTRYEKADFKKREALERDIVKLGEEIERLKQDPHAADQLRVKQQEYAVKKDELTAHLDKAKPKSARFARSWGADASIARTLTRQRYLPKSTNPLPQQALPSHPSATAGKLYWSAPPMTYYDMQGKPCTFGDFNAAHIQVINITAERLGQVRYILESSAEMAKNPRVLGIMIEQIEGHAKQLSDFSEMDDSSVIREKVSLVSNWLSDLDKQLQENAGALTVNVDDKATLTVQLSHADVSKIHTVKDMPMPEVTPGMRI